MTTQGDFHAMLDVLTELADESDSLSVDEALAALEALGNLASEVRRTASIVETAAKHGLESGSRQLGSRLYALADDGKRRYEHGDILRHVANAVSEPDADGEIPSAREAALRAAIWMRDLYVSPSTEPKKTALRYLGLGVKEVSRFELTGKKIEVIDLEAQEDE